MPDAQPRALLPADGDLVGVDQVSSGYRFRYPIPPPARFHQVIEQQRDDVVRRDERAILVHDPETVGVAIGGDADARAAFAHLAPQLIEQFAVRLGSMSAEQHIALVVYSDAPDARLAQQ